MEIKASTMQVRIAPRKIRLISDAIRKKDVVSARALLSFIKKRGAKVLEKTLKSALANAKNKNLKEENLFIKNIDILQGPALKRYRPSTRGRVHPYKKRTSHIKIILEEKQKEKGEKSGTKS